MPASARCECNTKSGKRCSNSPQPNGRCHVHNKYNCNGASPKLSRKTSPWQNVRKSLKRSRSPGKRSRSPVKRSRSPWEAVRKYVKSPAKKSLVKKSPVKKSVVKKTVQRSPMKKPSASDWIFYDSKGNEIAGPDSSANRGKGKQGEAFIVGLRGDSEKYIMKLFKKGKSLPVMLKEVNLLKEAGDKGLAPKLVDYSTDTTSGNAINGRPYIVMEKMEKTIVDHVKHQNGILSTKDQEGLVKLSQDMDELGIYHNDPNPLNYMLDKHGNWKYIDFGHSVRMSKKEHEHGNTRALTALMHSETQGLKVRRLVTSDTSILAKASYDAYVKSKMNYPPTRKFY